MRAKVHMYCNAGSAGGESVRKSAKDIRSVFEFPWELEDAVLFLGPGHDWRCGVFCSHV